MNFLNKTFPSTFLLDHDYLLTFEKEPDKIASEQFKITPTWKELADACIAYCKDENICLMYLGEQGAIRNGKNGQPYYFPDDVKVYIAEQIFKTTE